MTDVIARLRSQDVALKLTHGEGEAYYAWIDGELHHHRVHPTAESCEPGRDSVERFLIDTKFMSLFSPDFIPLTDSPFSREVGAGIDRSGGAE